jgi:ADP-ribose pyrophosphatase YjhB (NUDIX family)
VTTVGVFAAVLDEERRILCVRRAYPPYNWTLPGGLVEPNESPLGALVREVHEETRFGVAVTGLIGVYAAPYKDDLVLFFECSIASHEEWRPDDEIAEVAFMPAHALPDDFSPRTRSRVADAFAGTRGAVRVFADESSTAS